MLPSIIIKVLELKILDEINYILFFTILLYSTVQKITPKYSPLMLGNKGQRISVTLELAPRYKL